jgi:hypothetical protein
MAMPDRSAAPLGMVEQFSERLVQAGGVAVVA